MMEEIITNSMSGMKISHQELEIFLCEVCHKILGSEDTFKRHWKLHVADTTNQCPCGYKSPRLDAFRRHLSTKVHHTKVSTYRETPRLKVMYKLETRPYQVNPNSVSGYLYQQTIPKNKEPFPWILQVLDAPTRISRPYYTEDPIIIPLKPTEPLPDPSDNSIHFVKY